MSAVWKFPLPALDEVTIRMPVGVTVLHVGVQADRMYLWALVDPDAEQEDRRFRVAGTGHPIEAADAQKHIGSCLLHDGALVLHVFDLAAASREDGP